jgi:hypothetical protein
MDIKGTQVVWGNLILPTYVHVRHMVLATIWLSFIMALLLKYTNVFSDLIHPKAAMNQALFI